MLLKAGADPLVRNRDNQIPREVATRAQVVATLEEAEAPELHADITPVLTVLLSQNAARAQRDEAPPLLRELVQHGLTEEEVEQVRSSVSELHERDYSELDVMDLVAARMYTSNRLFRAWTEAMRAMPRPHSPPEAFGSMYCHLSSAIHNMTGPTEGQGLFCCLEGWPDGTEDGITYKESLIVTWKTFRSMTTNREAALALVDAGEDRVLFEIMGTPAGLGARLAPLSLYPDEEQVVLPAGLSFKVVGASVLVARRVPFAVGA